MPLLDVQHLFEKALHADLHVVAAELAPLMPANSAAPLNGALVAFLQRGLTHPKRVPRRACVEVRKLLVDGHSR